MNELCWCFACVFVRRNLIDTVPFEVISIRQARGSNGFCPKHTTIATETLNGIQTTSEHHRLITWRIKVKAQLAHPLLEHQSVLRSLRQSLLPMGPLLFPLLLALVQAQEPRLEAVLQIVRLQPALKVQAPSHAAETQGLQLEAQAEQLLVQVKA